MLYYPADRQVCSLQIYVQSEGLRFVEKSEYTVFPSSIQWFEQNSWKEIVTIVMIVVRELTTNRITRIIENMLIWLPWGSESATVIATITNVRNSVTENDVLSPEPIGKVNTIDNICISVLVTEMIIEFITVFIMFAKR
jgi:hypothetical protein